MKKLTMTWKAAGSCYPGVKNMALGAMVMLSMLAAFASPAFAADDDTPFFAGANGAPNIMFIFDNSDSMQDSPYRRQLGYTVRPGTKPSTTNSATENWPWKRGLQIDPATNFIKENASGTVLYDENAHPSNTGYAVPKQTPLSLPRVSGITSLGGNVDAKDTINSVVLTDQAPENAPGPKSAVTSFSNSANIYDANLTWAIPSFTDDAKFNANYEHRLVEIVEDTNQKFYGSIVGRDTANQFFTVDTLIPYALGKTYTYTVLTDGPGRVTKKVDNTTVTDADIDWTGGGIDSSFIGKVITIISGTNSGESREITGYSATNKAWTVGPFAGSAPGFTAPCDHTSFYQITDNSARIYDSSLDWTGTALSDTATFNANYLYRLVKVVSKDEEEQTRTIIGRDPVGKYFIIDASPAAGGPLSFSSEPEKEPYTYEILTDGPGRVTRVRTDAPVNNPKYVTDADIDWTTVSADFATKWKDKPLRIATGNNVGETKKISGFNASEKYWIVESGFSDPFDLNTDYTIVDTSVDDRYAFGGNHPASKLYQAKLALKTFLGHEKLKSCKTIVNNVCKEEKYALNMGFATYLSARVPRVTSTYYKKTLGAPATPDIYHPAVPAVYHPKVEAVYHPPTTGTWVPEVPAVYHPAVNPVFHPAVPGKFHPAQPIPEVPEKACDFYKNYGSATTKDFTNSYSKNSFVTTGSDWLTAPVGSKDWVANRLHTGVSVGYQFDRLYRQGQADEQSITYTVTKLNTQPGNDLPNFTTYTVSGTAWTALNVCVSGYNCSNIPNPHLLRELATPSNGYSYNCTYTPKVDSYTIPAYTDPDTPAYTTPGIPAYTTPAIPGYWAGARAEYWDPEIPAWTEPEIPAWTEPGKPAEPDYYAVLQGDTYGFYNVANANPKTVIVPTYVARDTGLVTPFQGYERNTWPQLKTPKLNPDPNAGDWVLVTAANAPSLKNVCRNKACTTKADIEENTFDTSYFVYPGYGTANQPHGWSYKKTTKPYIYGKSGSSDGTQNKMWSGASFPKYGSAGSWNITNWPGKPAAGSPTVSSWDWSTWGTATPNWADLLLGVSDLGGEMANYAGNDHTVFVHLPPYKGSDPGYGDDHKGKGIDKILEYVDTTRVNSPDRFGSAQKLFDYTIMPFTKSIAPNAYTALAGSGTPIADSLKDVAKYYESYIKQDPMSQGDCRKNYVIFLTDGLETGDLTPLAAEKAAADLMKLEVTINGEKKIFPIETYVIGFGLDEYSKTQLNAIAKAGSPANKPRGAYFADNVDNLVKILVDDITSSILDDSYSRSSPAITAFTPGQDLRIYSASFDYPSWRGHLKAYDLDPTTGKITGPPSKWLGDCNNDGKNDGDAGCSMKGQTRTVYTSYYNSGVLERIGFSTSNADKLEVLVNPFDFDIDGLGGTDGNQQDAETVISYILDAGYSNKKYRGTRDVSWPLGDIYHSAPAVIGPPRFVPPPPPALIADPNIGYEKFKAANKKRSTSVYVGANDGMVHAFNALDGMENWAYVPYTVLGKLHEIKDGHRFTVDLPLKAADIYSKGETGTKFPPVAPGQEEDGWHTMLVGGLRDGGRGYFALDVTKPALPAPIWEMTDQGTSDPIDRNLGKTWSTPSFGRIKIDGVLTYVIFAGGGIAVDNNTGNNLYIIDAATGKVLKEIPVGTADNHVPSEILVLAETDKDSNYYGNIITGYFGDTNGDLWKLTDLNDEKLGGDWAPKVVLLHNGAGKVFHKPVVSKSKGGCSVVIPTVEEDGIVYTDVEYTINENTTFVFYGTGDEENPTDETSTDRMYEIADPPLSRAGVTKPTMSLAKVWERQFPVGEKLLTDPLVNLGTLLFVTYSSAGGCDQGQSFLWGLTATRCGDAGMKAGLLFDVDGNNIKEEKIDLGPGITSSPVSGGPVLFIQQQGGEEPIQIPLPNPNRLEYWRENY